MLSDGAALDLSRRNVVAEKRSMASMEPSPSSTISGSTRIWAQAKTAGVRHDNTSYRTQLDYSGDRYGIQLERLVVGGNFDPEIGFVRRADMQKNFGSFRFSPRFASSV